MAMTTTIKAGKSSETIPLAEGKSLTLTGTAGTVGTAYLLDLVLGGTNSVRSWPVGTGLSATIGGYTGTQKVLITCTAGSIDATVGETVLALSSRVSAPRIPAENRMPTPGDNASAGYALNSTWQFLGQIYKPVAAPDATSAAWTLQQPQTANVIDLMGANAIFVGGLVAAKPGVYVGGVADISVVIAGVDTAQGVINALPSGEMDVAAYNIAAAKADAGTEVTIVKLYDQGPGGNHYLKVPGQPAPYIRWSARAGRYVIGFDSLAIGGAPTPRVLKAPVGTVSGGVVGSGYGVVGNAWATMIIGAGNMSAEAGGLCRAHVFGDILNGAAPRHVGAGVLSSGEMAIIRSAGQTLVNTPKILNNSNLAVTLYGSTAQYNYLMSVNDDEVTTTTSDDTAVYTSGYLGGYASGVSTCSTHEVLLIANMNVSLIAAQRQALRYGAYTRFDIRPQVMDQVVFIGDSRIFSAQPLAAKFNSLAGYCAEKLGKSARVYSLGIVGIPASGLLANIIPTAISKVKSVVTNIAVLLVGINEFLVSGVSAAAAFNNIVADCTVLKQGGYKVILINGLTTTSTTGAANVNLATLNALISAASTTGTGAEYILEMGGYSAITLMGNSAYSPEGIHLTPASTELIANAALPIVRSMLNASS